MGMFLINVINFLEKPHFCVCVFRIFLQQLVYCQLDVSF